MRIHPLYKKFKKHISNIKNNVQCDVAVTLWRFSIGASRYEQIRKIELFTIEMFKVNHLYSKRENYTIT